MKGDINVLDLDHHLLCNHFHNCLTSKINLPTVKQVQNSSQLFIVVDHKQLFVAVCLVFHLFPHGIVSSGLSDTLAYRQDCHRFLSHST